jgi:hypothetical protein
MQYQMCVRKKLKPNQKNQPMKFKSLILGVSAGMLLAGVSTAFGQTTNYLSLINPSFEDPTVSSGGYTTSTPGWSPNAYGGGVAAIINPSTPYINQDGSNVGQMFGNGGSSGFWFLQDLASSYTVGDTYTFFLNVNDPGGDDCELVLNIAGVAIEATTPVTTTPSTTLVPYSVSWTATQTGTIEVGLRSLGISGYDGIQFDSAVLQDVTPAPAPEPGTFAIAAMGGIGMLTLIRRRKN